MTLFTKKSDENKNEETTSSLGARIAELRKSKGYTQEEFSDMLGVSPQAVSKWENDLSCPDIMLIPQIAQIFEITTDELLTGKAPKREATEEIKKIKPVADLSKLKLRIQVLHPNKKPVNVTVPLTLVKKVAKIGNGISGIVGSAALNSEQLEQIFELVDEGATGEILNVIAEDNTNVIIEIS